MAANDKTEARKDLEKEAKKLKVEFEKEISDDDLAKKVSDAKEKAEAEEREKEILAEQEKQAKEDAKSKVILKDTLGRDVDQADYFFPGDVPIPGTDKKKYSTQTAPAYFNRICGLPVDREDLLEVFNQIFKPEKKFLFYKLRDKELYLVIVPLKYARDISKFTESAPGDFQRHGLSFIGEGSVNIDSLRAKLTRIAGHASILKD